MAKFLDLLITGTNALLSMNTALDVASTGMVAKAEELVTGAVEDNCLISAWNACQTLCHGIRDPLQNGIEDVRGDWQFLGKRTSRMC